MTDPALAERGEGDRLGRWREWVVPILISAALCVAAADMTAALMNREYFYQDDLSLMRPWRVRVFSNWLAGGVISHSGWGAAFFALVCITHLAHDRRSALFLIVGTFAALGAVYALPDTQGMKAWDLPALWLYAVIACAARRRRDALLAAASVVGVGFKETALLGAFLFLFREGWTRRRRVVVCAATLACGLVLRAALELAVGNPFLGSLELMEQDRGNLFTTPTKSHIAWNVAWLLHRPWTPLLINGGTLVAAALLPGRLPLLPAWRVVGTLFLLGNFIAGRISEPRIFLELIPPAIWALYDYATIGRPLRVRAPSD